MNEPVTLRLDAATRKRLDRLAKATERSRAALAAEAVRQFVEINECQPDFIFPSLKAYNDLSFPQAKLRMLAAKTTCKDRCRQITKEAKRIKTKHLLTLQDGISENQFKEICEENVKLVVPARLHKGYPKSVQPHLMTLESFIAEVRLLSV